MGLGKDKNAGGKAADAANDFLGMGIDELRGFADAGKKGLSDLLGGSSAGGLDSRLKEILNTDIFGSLVGERQRGAQAQLSAGGLTRSGTGLEAITNIGSDLALQLENMLTGRSSGLAGTGQNASNFIAQLLGQQGENVSSGILGDAQAKASAASSIGQIASGIFFSDPRLKTNVERVAELGNLGVYQWDWIPEAKDTIIFDCATIGFMADEVEELYPEFVGEFGGWKAIDYPNLLDTLEAKYAGV